MLITHMDISVKRVNESAILPTQANPGDAGWDLYSNGEYVIHQHETVKVGTGISVALPDYTFGAIYARSGLATKQGLRPANCVGVCDCKYRGEYIVALYNDSDEIRFVHYGDRIAQLIVQPFVPVTLKEADELDETERGEGGFGSSGT